MPVTSTFETVANELKTVIETEFAAEQFKVIFDNIHESLGDKRVCIGISLESQPVRAGRSEIRDTIMQIKFYDLWRKEITPSTVINPLKIAGYAERFMRAVEQHNNGRMGTSGSWFFEVGTIEYPNDPTGNKSRFVATVRSVGGNSALNETTG